jgi:hypothetical protein
MTQTSTHTHRKTYKEAPVLHLGRLEVVIVLDLGVVVVDLVPPTGPVVREDDRHQQAHERREHPEHHDRGQDGVDLHVQPHNPPQLIDDAVVAPP